MVVCIRLAVVRKRVGIIGIPLLRLVLAGLHVGLHVDLHVVLHVVLLLIGEHRHVCLVRQSSRH